MPIAARLLFSNALAAASFLVRFNRVMNMITFIHPETIAATRDGTISDAANPLTVAIFAIKFASPVKRRIGRGVRYYLQLNAQEIRCFKKSDSTPLT